MRLYKIDHAVLKIKGNVEKFLNGLTTNVLAAPFNAFVNLHGRIIATFRQKKQNDEEFLLAMPEFVVEDVLKHLSTYAKISSIKIEKTDHKVYVDIDSGEWLFNEGELSTHVSDEEFIRYRLKNNLPLLGVDYEVDEFILNVDSGQFVSFTKGCFLGQEPVAKVHNRSKPSKKLVAEGDQFVFIKN